MVCTAFQYFHWLLHMSNLAINLLAKIIVVILNWRSDWMVSEGLKYKNLVLENAVT